MIGGSGTSLTRKPRQIVEAQGGHEDPPLHLDPVESFDLADVLAHVIIVKM